MAGTCTLAENESEISDFDLGISLELGANSQAKRRNRKPSPRKPVPQSEDLDDDFADLRATTRSDRVLSAWPWFAEGLKRLSSLSRLQKGWHDNDIAPPNKIAVSLATIVLRRLSEIDCQPSHIDPSSDEGVCISFRRNSRYADVECFNNGEILAVTSDDRQEEPHIWELRPFEVRDAVAAISNHING